MPDLLLRQIDDQMVERIKLLARERRWSINDVILHALRHGLGLAPADPSTDILFQPGDAPVFAGYWDALEQAVFEEAVQALSLTPAAPAARGDGLEPA